MNNDIRLLIRDLREERGLAQKEIASILQTSQQQYSKYETGESELPIKALIALASYYDVSTDYLTGRTLCRQGVDSLNKEILFHYTVGNLVNDITALDNKEKRIIIELLDLWNIKNILLLHNPDFLKKREYTPDH